VKLTVITAGKGEIAGYAPSTPWDLPPGQLRMRIVAGPGQEAHEVEVQDQALLLGDRSQLLGHLQTLVAKKRQ
jgi:hypothetical protein